LALLLITLFIIANIANNIIHYSLSYRYAVAAYGVTLFALALITWLVIVTSLLQRLLMESS